MALVPNLELEKYYEMIFSNETRKGYDLSGLTAKWNNGRKFNSYIAQDNDRPRSFVIDNHKFSMNEKQIARVRENLAGKAYLPLIKQAVEQRIDNQYDSENADLFKRILSSGSKFSNGACKLAIDCALEDAVEGRGVINNVMRGASTTVRSYFDSLNNLSKAGLNVGVDLTKAAEGNEADALPYSYEAGKLSEEKLSVFEKYFDEVEVKAKCLSMIEKKMDGLKETAKDPENFVLQPGVLEGVARDLDTEQFSASLLKGDSYETVQQQEKALEGFVNDFVDSTVDFNRKFTKFGLSIQQMREVHDFVEMLNTKEQIAASLDVYLEQNKLEYGLTEQDVFDRFDYKEAAERGIECKEEAFMDEISLNVVSDMIQDIYEQERNSVAQNKAKSDEGQER